VHAALAGVETVPAADGKLAHLERQLRQQPSREDREERYDSLLDLVGAEMAQLA